MTIQLSAADLAALEAGGAVTLQGPTPAASVGPIVSPSGTVVLAGASAAITDAKNVLWTITAAGLVAVNGVADTTTKSVTKLAYVNGTVWQKNSAGLWWGKSSSTAAWSPSAGTATPPVAGQ
jgi:hypothetical protein